MTRQTVSTLEGATAGPSPSDPREVALVGRLEMLLRDVPPGDVEPEVFFGAQYDAGLAFVDFPEGLGGSGLPRRFQRLVDRRLHVAGAKSAMMRNPVGVGMGVATLMRHATPDQLKRYLRPCFTTAELWCQLFSEPGSGSDLAGLSTSARLEDGTWIVNGQKVWTSMGHRASVGMLLARTEPDEPKHRGLTFFLVDMHAPGVEVRPLRQITGDAEFNEVFLDDVRLQDDARVGHRGEGWDVARTTLMNERVLLSGAGSGAATVGGSGIEKLISVAQERGAWDDPVLRDELMRRFVESRIIRCTNLRAQANRIAGAAGPEGSVTKLFQGLFNRRLQDTATSVVGRDCLAWSDGDDRGSAVARGLLRAQGNTIEGGTTNIQRNILAERVLGMPREVGTSSELPWSQTRRNG